ncbi:hypothetical protein ACE102_46430 (plasmid) [Bradyrhizobium sp. vgs-9]|uniref:hypothetical protein n=1 Tax=Bradyrhizobium sp. vgs-9 TaxID=208389 RepID=UPI0035D42209
MTLVVGRMFWDTAAILDPKAMYLRGKALSRPITRQGGLAGELKQAGLQNVQETALTITMNFANFDDFWVPLDGGEGMCATYVAAFNVDKRQFKKALRLAYLDGSPDGPRTYFASAWAARGTRQR